MLEHGDPSCLFDPGVRFVCQFDTGNGLEGAQEKQAGEQFQTVATREGTSHTKLPFIVILPCCIGAREFFPDSCRLERVGTRSIFPLTRRFAQAPPHVPLFAPANISQAIILRPCDWTNKRLPQRVYFFLEGTLQRVVSL